MPTRLDLDERVENVNHCILGIETLSSFFLMGYAFTSEPLKKGLLSAADPFGSLLRNRLRS